MRRPGRREIRVVTLVTALVLALGVVSTNGPTSAVAAPTGPSWDDVQGAKGDVEATQIAVARIVESVAGMNAEFEQMRIAALVAGEQYQQATLALDQSTTTMATAERRRDAALDRADASGRQAALLATQLARAGGGDVTMALMASDNADDLLYRLGTMSALSARTDAVLTRAVQDRNVAASFSAQASLARDAHADLEAEAEAGYAAAAATAARAEQRAGQQQVLLGELSAKLAELTGRSAAIERGYLDSLESAPPPGGGGPSSPSPAPSQPAPNPSTPSAPSPSPSSPSPSAPPPSGPSPSPSPSSPAPSPNSPPVASGPQPNTAAVATAITFARAQVGEPYQFGAAGPNAWDCSGLTMMAYSAAGFAIGGHGSTAQYNRAAARGLLVPYSQMQPGDLIFYSSGG